MPVFNFISYRWLPDIFWYFPPSCNSTFLRRLNNVLIHSCHNIDISIKMFLLVYTQQQQDHVPIPRPQEIIVTYIMCNMITTYPHNSRHWGQSESSWFTRSLEFWDWVGRGTYLAAEWLECIGGVQRARHMLGWEEPRFKVSWSSVGSLHLDGLMKFFPPCSNFGTRFRYCGIQLHTTVVRG